MVTNFEKPISTEIEEINGNLSNKQNAFTKITETLTKTNATSGSYEKLGTFTLAKGTWLINCVAFWSSGKPLGVKIVAGDVSTDTDAFRTQEDSSGNPFISVMVVIGASSQTYSVFSKGGTVKEAKTTAYKIDE